MFWIVYISSNIFLEMWNVFFVIEYIAFSVEDTVDGNTIYTLFLK